MVVAPSGSPREVVARTVADKSFIVTWKEPEPSKQNGRIIFYVIEVTSLDRNHTKIINITGRSLVLSNVHPFYTYLITLAAATSAGQGPYSEPVFYVAPEDSELDF